MSRTLHLLKGFDVPELLLPFSEAAEAGSRPSTGPSIVPRPRCTLESKPRSRWARCSTLPRPV